jgi:hypothetical protein
MSKEEFEVEEEQHRDDIEAFKQAGRQLEARCRAAGIECSETKFTSVVAPPPTRLGVKKFLGPQDVEH